jgi:hypothetical protein
MSCSKGQGPAGGPGFRRFLFALAVLLCASQAQALTTAALLDTLQHTAFDYFWNQANPANGLIRDRSTSGSPCSIAALGFGLSAICIGIDHGWVTRDTGRARIQTALNTLWTQPQGPASGDGNTIGYKGLYYHFLDMNTARRTWLSELSTIDTALLLAGVLDTKQYFSTADPGDVQVRALVDSIYGRADWEFMRNLGPGIRMGWKPESGFNNFGTWVGYNEAMILYILALGSPTHPVPVSTWTTWTSGYSYQTQFGQTYVIFPPLFGHQYSHCWVDFHNIRDAYMTTKGLTYFENSRRATLAARAYCIANPGHFMGYGANLWGLTASDDPQVGYQAHGAPPAQNDNGTITPTAAASSIAFAPEVVIPTLHNMYDTYPLLWSTYGFKDAFNLTLNWYDTDYLGIDQGPIILMIENFRNRGVWKRMMANAAIQLGLQRAGFGIATDVASGDPGIERCVLFQSVPNPARGPAFIPFSLPRAGHAALSLYDVSGRRLLDLTDGSWTAGRHDVPLNVERLPSGVYYYRLEFDDQRVQRRLTVIR